MAHDLSEQLATFESDGLLVPEGVRYRRRGTRLARKAADALVSDGAALAVYLWSTGQLDLHVGDDALTAWAGLRRDVTVDPTPGKTIQWTAGRWESDAGDVLLVLTGHC
jgi:hypothetical protein